MSIIEQSKLVNVTQLSYNKESRTLSVEASSLRLKPGEVMRSFHVQSNKQAVVFILTDTHHRDGDVTHWDYLPLYSKFHKIQNCQLLRVYND